MAQRVEQSWGQSSLYADCSGDQARNASEETMPNMLNAAQTAEFNEKGFTYVRGLFAPTR